MLTIKLTLKLTLKLLPLLCTSALTVGSIVLPTLPSAHAQPGPGPLTSIAAQRPHLSVNPATGNDATADGSDHAPFKTLTRALQVAQPGAIVALVPGLYSAETGEVFPLTLKSGVTLRGNRETRGQGIVIRGGGVFLSPTAGRQNVALVAADQAALVGVTISNLEPGGHGLWVESTSLSITDNTFSASRAVGIAIVGNGAPLIQNNYFERNGDGLMIAGQARPQVWENIFENTGTAIVLQQTAIPSIVGNRITQNQNGVVIQDSARPVLRNNSIEGNTRDGLVTIAQAQPDLGTAAEPGGNVFRNNGQLDINAKQSQQVILAVGNQIGKFEGQVAAQLDRGVRSLPPPAAAAPASDAARSSQSSLAPSSAGSDVSADSFPMPTTLTAVLPPAQPIAASIPPPPQILPTPNRSLPLALSRSVLARSQPVLQPTPAPTPPAAIVIPVPPPESRAALPTPIVAPRPVPVSAVAPQPAAIAMPVSPESRAGLPASSPASPPAAIAIPVPPPESRTIAPVPAAVPPAAPSRVAPSAVQTGSQPSGGNLLPVPSGAIPIGNVGTGSGVAIYRARTATRPPEAPANLRYRVVTETKDSRQQAQVRTLAPGAFWTTLKGRSVMQLGAFGDRSKASELVQMLRNQGIAAAIETLE